MGKKNKKKKAFIGFNPQTEKRPRGLSLANKEQDRSVSWNIAILDKNGPFGWGSLDVNMFWNHIKNRFAEFEKLTWNEIFKHRLNHPIKVGDICFEAQKRLVEIELDDYDELTSLGITNVARVFGVRNGSKFSVLWWDPNHQICPSPKKDT
jgi:hypothetical protein